MQHMRYIIISPVRNEEEYLPGTIVSVRSQTIRPLKWIIVNDGSADRTQSIIDEAAEKTDWIQAVHRADRGFRRAGTGVMEAFHHGYRTISAHHWQFLVKLDGDLSFAADYFEKCFEHFKADARLGIGGGDIYNLVEGKFALEKNPRFHVRGATKIYRRECWDDIGGLLKAPGWDTLDEAKANMLGWSTRSFPELRVKHYRYTGSADGIWGGWVKNGRANYVAGYHPLFMGAKCLKRIFQRPYVVSAAGLFWGFLGGYLKGVRQVDDKALVRYIRKQQINRLLLRKSIWR
jgi:biofilm PGA synthesis N-glycosyltransferase PgaC